MMMMMVIMMITMMIAMITRKEQLKIEIRVHMSYVAFFLSFLYPRLGPVGLNWDTLYQTLNTEFDWEGAVRKALGTDDALEEVSLPSRT